MKVLAIGDIHGRDIWKRIIEREPDVDKIVFVGDYHDIYNYEFDDDTDIAKTNSISNLLEIIEYKKANMDKVILIIGNHDSHYIHDIQKCTRYDYKNSDQLRSIFKNNIDLFQYAWQYKDNIFIHAGITSLWMRYWKDGFYSYTPTPNGDSKTIQMPVSLTDYELNDDMSNLAECINLLGMDNGKGTVAVNDIPRLRGGYAPCGGVTWADYYELQPMQIIQGFNQYVGHNKVNSINTYYHEDSSITFLDVLHDYSISIGDSYLKIDLK